VRVIAERGNSIGSGSIVKVEGTTAYVLTAYHVIQKDAESGVSFVEVELFTEEKLRARISQRRIDTLNDIAVLTIENLPAQRPPEIPWGSSAELHDLNKIYTIGHPGREVGWHVTDGTISRIQGGKIYFSGTAVNSGNSGGPLLNEQGALVGMNLRLGDGQGTAIEANLARVIIHRWAPRLPAPVVKGETVSTKGTVSPPTKPKNVIVGKDGKEMLLVPEGSFWMGNTDNEIEAAFTLAKPYYSDVKRSWYTDEAPRHRVWVDGFYMDKYEVTVGEYRRFVRVGRHRDLPDNVSGYLPGGRANYPVVGVSWGDAGSYCRWARKRLPTEAEWEKAARGTDSRTYPWGNEAVDGSRANYCDASCESSAQDKSSNDRYKYTAPVGSYERGKSPYGIYDLAGNAWEWVEDWYDSGYYGRSPERNPVNKTKSGTRVLRGGGWGSSLACIRTAYRRNYAPHGRDGFGFRCVIAVSASKD